MKIFNLYLAKIKVKLKIFYLHLFKSTIIFVQYKETDKLIFYVQFFYKNCLFLFVL